MHSCNESGTGKTHVGPGARCIQCLLPPGRHNLHQRPTGQKLTIYRFCSPSRFHTCQSSSSSNFLSFFSTFVFSIHINGWPIVSGLESSSMLAFTLPMQSTLECSARRPPERLGMISFSHRSSAKTDALLPSSSLSYRVVSVSLAISIYYCYPYPL